MQVYDSRVTKPLTICVWFAGARSCIGRRFAEEEARIAIIRIYQKCAWGPLETVLMSYHQRSLLF